LEPEKIANVVPESTNTATRPNWQLLQDRGRSTLVLTGDWIALSGQIPAFASQEPPITPPGQPLRVDTTRLGRWDSALVAFLWDVKRAGLSFDKNSMPDAMQKLLGLLPEHIQADPPPRRWRFRPLRSTGAAALGSVAEIGVLSTLLADTATGAVGALRGRARIRGVDLLQNVWDAGPAALLIVSVVNFLIGAILAFVGAAQLRKFAADAYVANLVGLALVREMAAVMTAIVMAGRTGGAYAARIATMQGNEEIDALQVIGIPVSDYILLPSILALVFTMPVLYLYGCLIGMIGGLAVACAMLNITVAGYIEQTLQAVPFDQFTFGFCKSIAFAVLIGVTSCRIGLRAGRSAADVGLAATRAVVVGIVGVIALDAMFAVVADTLGI